MIEKIAYNLGLNNEEPNIKVAEMICESKNKSDLSEIVEGLKNKNKCIANDCIKVLYEIGEREPELIADYVSDFINLLKSKNNRLVWGGMTALAQIVELKGEEIYNNINIVFYAYENGSVITRDNSITVFAKLAKFNKTYEDVMVKKICDHLNTCRPKEVAQHAERASICINGSNLEKFEKVLLNRYEILTDSQKKRIDKLMKKLR